MSWVWAAQSWLPTIAVALMAVLAFLAALAQAPRMAKLYWLIAVLVCGALAIAVAAWQQNRELAQVRELSSHLGALARLLPGGPPASPEQTVDSLATSMYSLNARISELQGQIEALREKTKIDSAAATKLADYLRPFGSHRVVVSCVPNDVEAFTYANQIGNLLRSAGWDAHGPETTAIFGDAPAMGIRLYVRSGVAPDTAKILLDAFSRFDIPYQSGVTSNDMIPDNTTVELFVSHKP